MNITQLTFYFIQNKSFTTEFWKVFHKAQHGEFEADLGKPPHTTMLIMPALRIPMGKPRVSESLPQSPTRRIWSWSEQAPTYCHVDHVSTEDSNGKAFHKVMSWSWASEQAFSSCKNSHKIIILIWKMTF